MRNRRCAHVVSALGELFHLPIIKCEFVWTIRLKKLVELVRLVREALDESLLNITKSGEAFQLLLRDRILHVSELFSVRTVHCKTTRSDHVSWMLHLGDEKHKLLNYECYSRSFQTTKNFVNVHDVRLYIFPQDDNIF